MVCPFNEILFWILLKTIWGEPKISNWIVWMDYNFGTLSEDSCHQIITHLLLGIGKNMKRNRKSMLRKHSNHDHSTVQLDLASPIGDPLGHHNAIETQFI